MSSGCRHPKNHTDPKPGLVPHLGDKKPESRFNLFNSASQTFVNMQTRISSIRTGCQQLVFAVPVVKNATRLSQTQKRARTFLQKFFTGNSQAHSRLFPCKPEQNPHLQLNGGDPK
jgi:hypothetical protein